MTKNPGNYDVFRNNLYSSSGIYINSVTESQCHIITENSRKQYEVKKSSRVDYVTKAACITKRGSSFDNIIFTVANLHSDTNTME